MKKISKMFALVGMLFTSIQADFNPKIRYSVNVLKSSPWGVYLSSIKILNNSAATGIFSGEDTGCFCCPSMEYGVTQWSQPAATGYECGPAEKAKLPAKQGSITCPVTDKPAAKTVNYAQYFINIKQFVQSAADNLKKSVARFPDISQGQGFHSKDYLSFCSTNTSSFNRNTQLETAVANVSSLIQDASGYFLNEQFEVSLDFSILTGQ